MNKYDQGWKENRGPKSTLNPTVRDLLDEWERKEKEEERMLKYAYIAIIFIGLSFAAFMYFTVKKREVTLSQYDLYSTYFQAHKSPVPNLMTSAVLQTKRPAIMAAIAVVESNGTPWAVGDNGKSRGAFQVQERYWGAVPVDPVEQALQAERILEELLKSRGRLRCAITAYNGAGPAARAYERRVARLERSLIWKYEAAKTYAN